ncbi:E3 ubiquitin-protein ligase RMA3-like [Diospyros lotus]|uniref:E3 ubiquitin-protein ligase RMA3-like n=1 Tax=Diospyros lotus TaxID=55363 RepID=UPI00224F052A|nr:E3 ubiquitin-protein ligase RMA3-like [Diospyros lotus]XP_052208495.1 E3 ubiquitin-protein ligase RMA3-like [Diospyros lotus]XP_052208496.1 E3 ubiquitin-protein ligase RMA3-like [Diospyros lotus]XP_052208497.1 E3 ubiquitin-protein ligase RMA3-like [Diospyros lotus]
MAYEQEIHEHIAQFESNGEVALKQKWKPVSAPKTASENASGCFDCNICLDSAVDPVVTLCGHLYCWPCIYKWLHVQSSSDESDEEPKCPVCKANISETSLVPLYGRGSSPSESDARRPQLDLIVPHRPPAHGSHTLLTRGTSVASHPNHQQFHSHPFHQAHPQPFHHQQYFPHPYGNYDSTSPSNFSSTAMASSIFSPTVGMFGEMIFARIFGSLDASLFPYHYSNAYPLTGNGSPRMRRQEMQVEKSLSRVSIFLFCCFVLCLLLF